MLHSDSPASKKTILVLFISYPEGITGSTDYFDLFPQQQPPPGGGGGGGGKRVINASDLAGNLLPASTGPPPKSGAKLPPEVISQLLATGHLVRDDGE